jgi:hypothetical protein
MANSWGSGYVDGAPRKIGTRIKLDSELRNAVPGFRLVDAVDSGTTANERAMAYATNGNFGRCLIGMGSYVGGVGTIESLSSTKATSNWQLSLVKSPTECSETTRYQTVPLPYHIQHKLHDLEKLHALEDQCLKALETKCTIAALMGRPFKAFLLEYVLSGTGGELSTRFLESLATTLAKFNITIIADEIMTGGRVGPTLAMTNAYSENFIKSVGYITLGKVFGCGLVLENVHSVIAEEKPRGTTTEIDVSDPFGALVAIRERIAAGMIEGKRSIVLAKLNLEDPEDVWGKGLLMFSSKCRPGIINNLKNRLLPSLETNRKTKITLGFKDCPWNRSVVDGHLHAQAKKWLDHVNSVYECNNISPYTVELAKYLCDSTNVDNCAESTVVYATSILEYMKKRGMINDETLVTEYRARKKRKEGKTGGRSTASHTFLVHGTLNDAATKSNGFVTKELKHKKRQVCFTVRFDLIN